ncbi:MAG: NAD(P)H-hydrate dehydratase, partial [bacterium]|nr:NAD(P)H-hydrate dehydratase [bacterium]
QFNTLFDSFAAYPKNETVVVDALFGTGLNKPVSEGLFSETIDRINNSGFKIAAVDLPSGLSEAFLPEEGPHITADVTATFQCLKAAHIHPDGNAHCGEITVVDIGIPKELLKNEKYYIDITTADDCRELMKKSAVDAHKGSFGHGLTIAGSIDKPGAGILSSFSLLRSGAGLCTAAVPKENRLASILGHPELMTLIYKDIRELTDAVSGGKFDVVLAGPGMGNTPATGAVLSMLLEKTPNGQPLVLDADALNALAEGAGVSKKIPMGKGPIILTPHPGEFSRLTGLTAAEIKRDRIALAREFAVKNRLFLVLKGHHTITATPAGRVFLNPTGNPGMATAGSGDVLGGIIAGMLCRYGKSQTVDLILRTAVFVHGLAGDMAAREKGEISLTASDIIDYIPRAFTALQSPSYNHEYTGSINFA